MQTEQTEQVLLVLSKKNGQVAHIVNIDSTFVLNVCYTTQRSCELAKHAITSKTMFHRLWLTRYRGYVLVSELKHLFGRFELSTVTNIKVQYNNSWFHLLVSPLKSGPACFVEHVVL